MAAPPVGLVSADEETMGLTVELTTVLRAGQSVTVAAHEVMVTNSVEYRVDSGASLALAATEEVVVGATVAATTVEEEVDEVVDLVIWKGLEYWKVVPVLSPSQVIFMP